MKRSITSFCAVIGVVTALLTPSVFATNSVEEVIETLHQAEKSPAPLPLIQKAQEQMRHYNPRVWGGHFRANNAATRNHKEEAIDRLQQAIDVASQGQNPNEKIHAAIAEIRLAGEFRH